jgi:hypothetical protein
MSRHKIPGLLALCTAWLDTRDIPFRSASEAVSGGIVLFFRSAVNLYVIVCWFKVIFVLAKKSTVWIVQGFCVLLAH